MTDIYEVIASRRDVRNGFTMAPVDDDVLTRVLGAAHQAPSVGFSQPWDFIVIRDETTRRGCATSCTASATRTPRPCLPRAARRSPA